MTIFAFLFPYSPSLRSLLLGPLFIALFFLFSLVTVFGLKTLISPFLMPKKPVSPPAAAPKKKRKTYRTVNIDPDEVDRISFGKK